MKAAEKKPRTRRVNVIFREDRLAAIDRARGTQDRSSFLEEAALRLAKEKGRARLRELLEEEAKVNRERDLEMLAEWAGVDEEVWQRNRR